MSRIFLAYKFTGENQEDLSYRLGNIKKSLGCAGHDTLCSFFLEDYFRLNNFTREQIYGYMLQRQKESETFMAFLTSENESKGMLMESDEAVRLNQRCVVLTRPDINMPQFYKPANEIIFYNSFPELFSRLKTFR